MRNRITLAAAIVVSVVTQCMLPGTASAQEADLANSRRSSYYTFIYRVSNEEAGRLFRSVWNLDTTFLTDLYDFYPTDSIYKKNLPLGHYVFVKAVNDDLNIELRSVNNLQLHLLDNFRDLIMVFSDSAGNVPAHAEVRVRKRIIPYDEKIHAYRLPKTNRRGIVSVEHHGHVSYFEIDRSRNNTFFVRTGRKLLNTFPVNHIVSPLIYIKNNVRSLIKWGQVEPPGIYHRLARVFRPKATVGYMAFNQPTFRPGDTVRFKAMITTRKGRPINRKAEVFLRHYFSGDPYDKGIGSVEPFRKGAYEFAFRLEDTLGLRLDNSYAVELRDRKGNRLQSGSFRYEDYELKNNVFYLRTEQSKGKAPSKLFLRGEDTNGLPLFNTRAAILLKPTSVQNRYVDIAFVPDTLWFHETRLEAVGETIVTIPDSVMPPASLTYHVNVAFYDASNERIVKEASLKFDHKSPRVTLEVVNDSVHVFASEEEKVREATLIRLAGDLRAEKVVMLPHVERLDYFATGYEAVYQDGKHTVKAALTMNDVADQLEVITTRTKDSLRITTSNPRRIPFRYFLFRNRTLLERGEGDTLDLKRKAHSSDHFSLSVQYVWAGIPQNNEYNAPFERRVLDVSLDHAPVIYPGEKTAFTVNVRDASNRPVANADVTAYAITKKFSLINAPEVPSFPERQRTRLVFNQFRQTDTEHVITRYIDGTFWRKTLGLDSIAFYKFIFPDTGYFEYRMPVETSQFSPFVVRRGSVAAAQVIYVDGQPVYYHDVDTREPYAFHISPGRHTVDIRLSTGVVTIRDVVIREKEKLIFSVDRANLPPNATETEAPVRLTDEEVARLSRYFMVVRSNHGTPDAYIQQGDTYRLFAEPERSYYRGYSVQHLLAGPFYPGKATFALKDSFQIAFDYEPLSTYEFRRGAVKMVRTDIAERIGWSPYWNWSIPSFKQHALTRDSIQRYWKALDVKEVPFETRIPDINFDPRHAGRLTLDGLPEDVQEIPIKAVFLMNLENPDIHTIILKKVEREPFLPGNYEAVVILGNEHYLKVDSIVVKPYGTNYHSLESEPVFEPDSLSAWMMKMVAKWSNEKIYLSTDRLRELMQIRGQVAQQASSDYIFDHTVSGVVRDGEGNPVPGVNVIVKGTALGTVTGVDGSYTLNCPPNGTLVFSFIGYQTTEKAIGSRGNIDAGLGEDVTQLSEVVVVGYASTKRRNLTAAAMAVQGRAPGVAVRGPRYANEVEAMIRGDDRDPGLAPIYLLDGVVVSADKINAGNIFAMEVIAGEEATALYGSRAANGVVLLSTQPGITRDELIRMSIPQATVAAFEDTPGNALRTHFRDYAFWQPRLITGQDGKARFEATFPDDITGWRAHILAMAGKRTGQTSTTIRSYKPLVAQIAQPHFLIKGDTSTAIGKITNYGADTVNISRLIAVNDAVVTRDSLSFKDSHLDTIRLAGFQRDSLSVRYTIGMGKYNDGELRTMPIYAVGVSEAKGGFFALDRDTTIRLTFAGDTPVKVYAQADLVEVVYNEIQFLRNYAFDCNEQLASRIIALLLEKRIRTWRNEKFTGERELNKAIRKLVGHQNGDGGWAWWGTGQSRPWITLHVARSLNMADKEGFAIPVDHDALITYLELNIANVRSDDRLALQAYLLERGEKLYTGELVDSVIASDKTSLHDKLQAQRLLQLSGGSPDLGWIMSQKSTSVKGNSYWGDESFDMKDNSVHNTLLAYKIIERERPNSNELIKIRNYFLEKRRNSWRNTYESSLILETILPGIMAGETTGKKPQLEFAAPESQIVNEFPFEYTFGHGETITVTKRGTEPVYLTAYQETWNTTPTPVDKDFAVTTFLEDSARVMTSAKPVDLMVTVNVHGSSEYVMIEVPIPAGCSYASRPQSNAAGEVHREYHHHKVNIYCEHLEKGTYTYRIPLLPRFTGSYTLNPAVASCMYFPVLTGREGLKRVKIQ